jgi:rubrerythrin
MVKFVCKNCNYRFESSNPFDCPYCGREDFEKEKNASELLQEIEQLLGS